MDLLPDHLAGGALEVVQQPHKPLPVQVWLGQHLVAELPDQETLLALRRGHVLQRLRLRLLAQASAEPKG